MFFFNELSNSAYACVCVGQKKLRSWSRLSKNSKNYGLYVMKRVFELYTMTMCMMISHKSVGRIQLNANISL